MRRRHTCAGWTASLALLWSASTVAADPAAAAGERLFRNQCLGCHSLGPGQNRAGPSLHGLFGRRSGTLEGFDFSPAMREAGIVWRPESLDTFLQSPADLVPGTKMVFWGLDAEARRRIVVYLESAGQVD